MPRDRRGAEPAGDAIDLADKEVGVLEIAERSDIDGERYGEGRLRALRRGGFDDPAEPKVDRAEGEEDADEAGLSPRIEKKARRDEDDVTEGLRAQGIDPEHERQEIK